MSSQMTSAWRGMREDEWVEEPAGSVCLPSEVTGMRRQMPLEKGEWRGRKKLTSIVVRGRCYHSNSVTPFDETSIKPERYKYGNAVHSNTNSKHGSRTKTYGWARFIRPPPPTFVFRNETM